MLQYLQANSRPELTIDFSQCARFTHPKHSHGAHWPIFEKNSYRWIDYMMLIIKYQSNDILKLTRTLINFEIKSY